MKFNSMLIHFIFYYYSHNTTTAKHYALFRVLVTDKCAAVLGLYPVYTIKQTSSKH